MILVPAIDLAGGRCVRLAQGDFTRETVYGADPAATLQAFAEAGATEAHVVDLDGARERGPRQHDLIAGLAERAPLRLQVAGGFRTVEQVARLLDSGAARVVIGSLALDEPGAFAAMLARFSAECLTLALDVRLEGDEPRVAGHGWTTDSGRSLDDVLGQFPEVRHLLVTDIARDGMLQGPNLSLMTTIAARYPAIAVQASGGVATLDDLPALRATGAARAIVGKALWERRFTLAEGLAHARG